VSEGSTRMHVMLTAGEKVTVLRGLVGRMKEGDIDADVDRWLSDLTISMAMLSPFLGLIRSKLDIFLVDEEE